MNPVVETLNFILGTGGVLMLALAVVLFVDILFFKREKFSSFVERWGLLLAAILPLSAMVMALVYSEYFGFVPCSLCWTMRIFVFSQALIMPAAYYRKDFGVVIYGIILSVPGIVIGLYQHYLQVGGEGIGCFAGEGDCAKRILFEYGFMTFPLMGTSMLLLLLAIYIYLYKREKTPDISNPFAT